MPRRQTFCLGCGVVGSAHLSRAQSEQEPAGVALPGWCKAEACQEQRERFDATADRIIREHTAGKVWNGIQWVRGYRP